MEISVISPGIWLALSSRNNMFIAQRVGVMSL